VSCTSCITEYVLDSGQCKQISTATNISFTITPKQQTLNKIVIEIAFSDTVSWQGDLTSVLSLQDNNQIISYDYLGNTNYPYTTILLQINLTSTTNTIKAISTPNSMFTSSNQAVSLDSKQVQLP
jgi:hypothetical protein